MVDSNMAFAKFNQRFVYNVMCRVKNNQPKGGEVFHKVRPWGLNPDWPLLVFCFGFLAARK